MTDSDFDRLLTRAKAKEAQQDEARKVRDAEAADRAARRAEAAASKEP